MALAEEFGVASPDTLTLLRALAETQQAAFLVSLRDHLRQSRSRMLVSVKLPEFDGNPSTTVQKYRSWRKSVLTIRELNQLNDKELALMVFSQVPGSAKMLLETLEVTDVAAPTGVLERGRGG